MANKLGDGRNFWVRRTDFSGLASSTFRELMDSLWTKTLVELKHTFKLLESPTTVSFQELNAPDPNKLGYPLNQITLHDDDMTKSRAILESIHRTSQNNTLLYSVRTLELPLRARLRNILFDMYFMQEADDLRTNMRDVLNSTKQGQTTLHIFPPFSAHRDLAKYLPTSFYVILCTKICLILLS